MSGEVLTGTRVSIPQSGFCLVEPDVVPGLAEGSGPFQSLSRDSVWLSPVRDLLRDVCGGVSIPQSGFCLVEPSGSPPLFE